MSPSPPADDAPTWDAVVGQPHAVAALRSALRRDEVAHAWLLVGPPGVGQRQLHRALTAALDCERTGLAAAGAAGADGVLADEGCGACRVCRNVARGTWTAMRDLEPEGAQHRVADVRRTWIGLATRTATEGRRKVLRVVAADAMNETAQNAFLKVLEEPPPSVVWVLEAADDAQLLDTIVSRCRRLDLSPWTPSDLTASATARGTADPADPALPALVRAAAGSPDRLDALLGRRDEREANLEVLDRLVREGPVAVPAIAEEVVGRGKGRGAALEEEHRAALADLPATYGVERDAQLPAGVRTQLVERQRRRTSSLRGLVLEELLDDLGTWLRDVLVVAAGGDPGQTVNRDRPEQLRRDAARFDPRDLLAGLAAIDRAREAFERNGNPQLQLERVLLALAGPAFDAGR